MEFIIDRVPSLEEIEDSLQKLSNVESKLQSTLESEAESLMKKRVDLDKLPITSNYDIDIDFLKRISSSQDSSLSAIDEVFSEFSKRGFALPKLHDGRDLNSMSHASLNSLQSSQEDEAKQLWNHIVFNWKNTLFRQLEMAPESEKVRIFKMLRVIIDQEKIFDEYGRLRGRQIGKIIDFSKKNFNELMLEYPKFIQSVVRWISEDFHVLLVAGTGLRQQVVAFLQKVYVQEIRATTEQLLRGIYEADSLPIPRLDALCVVLRGFSEARKAWTQLQSPTPTRAVLKKKSSAPRPGDFSLDPAVLSEDFHQPALQELESELEKLKKTLLQPATGKPVHVKSDRELEQPRQVAKNVKELVDSLLIYCPFVVEVYAARQLFVTKVHDMLLRWRKMYVKREANQFLPINLASATFLRNQLSTWCKTSFSDEGCPLQSALRLYDTLVELETQSLCNHCTFSIVNNFILDAESNDWSDDKPFQEDVRCSFSVSAWHLQMLLLRRDLFGVLAPFEARVIFRHTLEHTLSLLTARYVRVASTKRRLKQLKNDIITVLLAAGELIQVTTDDMNRLQIETPIHSSCLSLMAVLIVVCNPLKDLQRRISSEKFRQKSSPDAWLRFVWTIDNLVSRERQEEMKLLFMVKLLAHQYHGAWSLLTQVLVARRNAVASLLVREFLNQQSPGARSLQRSLCWLAVLADDGIDILFPTFTEAKDTVEMLTDDRVNQEELKNKEWIGVFAEALKPFVIKLLRAAIPYLADRGEDEPPSDSPIPASLRALVAELPAIFTRLPRWLRRLGSRVGRELKVARSTLILRLLVLCCRRFVQTPEAESELGISCFSAGKELVNRLLEAAQHLTAESPEMNPDVAQFMKSEHRWYEERIKSCRESVSHSRLSQNIDESKIWKDSFNPLLVHSLVDKCQSDLEFLRRFLILNIPWLETAFGVSTGVRPYSLDCTEKEETMLELHAVANKTMAKAMECDLVSVLAPINIFLSEPALQHLLGQRWELQEFASLAPEDQEHIEHIKESLGID